MPVTLAQAQKEALASAKATILHCLTIEHAAWSGSLNVVQDLVQHDLTDETAATRTYLPVPFSFSAPEVGPDGAHEMRVELDNAPADVSDLLDQAVEAAGVITVTYRAWDAADPSAPVYGPISINVAEASASLERVSLRCADTDVTNRAYPNDDYTPTLYPELVA